MVIRVKNTPSDERTKYGLFGSFLVTEADDEPAPRANTKVINLRNGNRTDFSAGTDEINDNIPDEPPTPEPVPEELPPETPPAEPEVGEEEPAEDFSAGSENLGGEEPPQDLTGAAPDDQQGDDQATIDAEGGEEAPAEDFSAGSENLGGEGEEGGDGGEEAPADDQAQTDDGGGEGSGEMDLDTGRKYVLFKDFKNLYATIDELIKKIDSLPRSGNSENVVMKKSTRHLKKLKSMVYDWMILRFQTKSYFQSLYFFQQAVVACQLVINTIDKLGEAKSATKK